MLKSIRISIGDFILRGINLYLRSRLKINKNRVNRESTLIYANKTKDVISTIEKSKNQQLNSKFLFLKSIFKIKYIEMLTYLPKGFEMTFFTVRKGHFNSVSKPLCTLWLCGKLFLINSLKLRFKKIVFIVKI